MAASIYEFSNYKKYVNSWVAQAPNKGRGLRKLLAEAIGCQTPFITHVLSGDYDFSLEQAEACARWMGLDEEEIEFFLLLVIKNRAGTRSLEKVASKQIAQRRERHAVLKDRLKIEQTLSREDQMQYYSDWIYAAVHMGVLIPSLQTVDGLCAALKLSTPKVISILEYLSSRGLVKKEGRIYRSARSMLHLESNSPLLKSHLTNWRLRSLESEVLQSSENLHYSGVMTLSQEDFEWLREKLSAMLQEAVERLKTSKDERLACLNFDWFHIA